MFTPGEASCTPGVDQARDLQAGQRFGDALNLITALGVLQSQSLLPQQRGPQGELFGRCRRQCPQALQGRDHRRHGLRVQPVGIAREAFPGKPVQHSFRPLTDGTVRVQLPGALPG